VTIDRSPIARKIILSNMLAILLLVAGVLFLDPTRDSLVSQREAGLASEARLVAQVFEASLAAGPGGGPAVLRTGAPGVLSGMDLPRGVEVHVLDPSGRLLAEATGAPEPLPVVGMSDPSARATVITGAMSRFWTGLGLSGREAADVPASVEVARDLAGATGSGETSIRGWRNAAGPVYTVVAPIEADGRQAGAVAVTTRAGEVEELLRLKREQVLQLFLIAVFVSIGLSLVLASTIANPLSDLSAAAEVGRDVHARLNAPQRIRIPDMSARPDEIGRLSQALRGMVAALYDRIDSNEHFAADVAHEIKNPLASLRAAVGTLRVARGEDQRERLIGVIEHDVRRLDRLVSDISNASRLDSELVKEEEEPFDLVALVSSLCAHHGGEAEARGITLVTDLPEGRIPMMGLEARLAQVIVNLVTNAVSFCVSGDAVRVWIRRRGERVLLVVEDTGPGIPEAALSKVFERFYSERPDAQFGDHSGLGLHISRQIVEAHGGVIWAENIRPTDYDPTSEPLGARFVVGLPL
jgi:two-component system sensor histidine kinase ChvG